MISESSSESVLVMNPPPKRYLVESADPEMQKRIEKFIKKVHNPLPRNHGKRWTAEEDNQLLNFSEVALEETARIFGRTPFAIFCRFLLLSGVEMKKDIPSLLEKFKAFMISKKNSAPLDSESSK